ncbi:MAG: cyclic diguanylate phosphodiesterase [Leptolyngbya sp. SIOISBB]|nr:cyclic diguanylate phosphodiesterase [Leptolyngbya sp. SIOISBB]
MGIFSVALLPQFLLFFLGYFHTIFNEKQNLRTVLELGDRQMSSLMRAAEITLEDVKSHLTNDLDETSINESHVRRLQKIVYEDPRFREIGIVNQDGYLYLTNLGVIEPPVLLSESNRSDPLREEMQIIGPVTTTVMQEQSVIFALPTEDQGEVNLLVNPVILNYWLGLNSLNLGPDGYIAYVLDSDQEIIAGTGLLPRNGVLSSQTPDRSRIQLERRLEASDITIVVDVSKAWVLGKWIDFWKFGIPLSIASSLLIALFGSRFFPPQKSLEGDIPRALFNDEFRLHYQPVVDMETGSCIGCEALIRWQHTDRGLLFPGVFIPVAEETKLIVKLGDWIIQKAIEDLYELLIEHPYLYLSINLSPIQLVSGNDSRRIVNHLKKYHQISKNLIFEITENILIEDNQTNIPKALLDIQDQGAKIALDDFGTGHSGISYLSKLKVDYLKIDRRFITDGELPVHATSLLEGMIDLGRRLQVTLVAEGVETEFQKQGLLKKGVRYGQGYLWAKPMPIEEFHQFLATHSQEVQLPSQDMKLLP